MGFECRTERWLLSTWDSNVKDVGLLYPWGRRDSSLSLALVLGQGLYVHREREKENSPFPSLGPPEDQHGVPASEGSVDCMT